MSPTLLNGPAPDKPQMKFVLLRRLHLDGELEAAFPVGVFDDEVAARDMAEKLAGAIANSRNMAQGSWRTLGIIGCSHHILAVPYEASSRIVVPKLVAPGDIRGG